MKCFNCNSCVKVRVIENRLYMVCFLCKKVYLPPKTKTGKATEIEDIEEVKRLLSYLEINIIE